MTGLDVLIPTYGRPDALAVVLTSLLGQRVAPTQVFVSDQSEDGSATTSPLVAGVVRVLRQRGVEARLLHHPTGQGVAENRQFLLEQATTDYVLYLDDDIVLEPEAIERLVSAMGELRCGAVGLAMTGLSHHADVRPGEQESFEPVEPPVNPERVRKDGPGWERWRLHNAANPTHLGERLGYGPRTPGARWTAYKVAWVAGCVLFDRSVLLDAGGFDFWPQLGRHGYGEDVAAQLRVMERAGAVGLLPTAANHLELPSSLSVRERDAYELVFGEDVSTAPPVDNSRAHMNPR
jgi:glycosyltransferase involved in cell wall biosynthesis